MHTYVGQVYKGIPMMDGVSKEDVDKWLAEADLSGAPPDPHLQATTTPHLPHLHLHPPLTCVFQVLPYQ
jgi:hypothetical protein